VSRIYFHTPDETAEVKGSERAYMRMLAADVALAVLKPDYLSRDWLMSITDGPDYLDEEEHWKQRWETWFRLGEGDLIASGEKIGAGELALNTLIALGSELMKFVARVDGSCEDHAWCAPENAGWLGALIRQGRRENVLRPRQGWGDVADLFLRARIRGDYVVCSYSVSDSFPNRYVVGEHGELLPSETEEAAEHRWYELSDRERWDLALEAIKARKYNRELKPNDDRGFLSGASAFDLVAEQWLARSDI
jgi:hypothetical protein